MPRVLRVVGKARLSAEGPNTDEATPTTLQKRTGNLRLQRLAAGSEHLHPCPQRRNDPRALSPGLCVRPSRQLLSLAGSRLGQRELGHEGVDCLSRRGCRGAELGFQLISLKSDGLSQSSPVRDCMRRSGIPTRGMRGVKKVAPGRRTHGRLSQTRPPVRGRRSQRRPPPPLAQLRPLRRAQRPAPCPLLRLSPPLLPVLALMPRPQPSTPFGRGC